MKKLTLFAVALAALCSCNKSEMPAENAGNSGNTVEIIANAIAGEASKVTMGAKDGSVYPISWNESGECVFLRECVRSAGTTADCGSASFTKVDAKSAKFTFSLAAKTTESTYDYVAVYPCDQTNYKTSLNHGVRYGGDDAKNRVSYILNHTISQVPLADAPDPATHLMIATSLGLSAQAASLNLEFKHLVGFGKMTLKNFPALAADETVSKITLTVPDSKKMAGRMYHYYHENSDGSHHAGDVIPYNDSNVKNYVMIDPTNITFNTTGFDVWFTTFPVSLAEGDIVSLNVETSKTTYTANITLSKELKFEAGVVSEFIYDYEKGQPKAETKTLAFDFSADAMKNQSGWPTAKAWYTETQDSVCVYKLNDKEYKFILCYYSQSSGQIICDANGLVMYTSPRYVGLPALEDYKLISAVFEQGTTPKSSRKSGICVNTPAAAADIVCVSGGETQSWSNSTHSFNLSGTNANTVYYWFLSAGGLGAKKITLTYEKVEK